MLQIGISPSVLFEVLLLLAFVQSRSTLNIKSTFFTVVSKYLGRVLDSLKKVFILFGSTFDKSITKINICTNTPSNQKNRP